MWRNNEEKVRGSILQITIENRKINPSKVPETLQCGFVAKKGINTPD